MELSLWEYRYRSKALQIRRMLIGCVVLSELLNLSAPPLKNVSYYELILNIHNCQEPHIIMDFTDIFIHIDDVY